MDYVDYTVVRLADDGQRAALFDQNGLALIAQTAYDATAMTLGPPYSAVFEQVFMGVSLPPRTRAQASWSLATGLDRRDGSVTVFGLGAAGAIRVDALWRGAVIATASSPLATVQQVTAAWPDPGQIDAQIIAALGALPTDPAQLESQRRTRLMALLATGMAQPAALTDAVFDAWLAGIGAATAGDAITRYPNQLLAGTLQLAFSAAPTATSPVPLSISAAILVRDAPLTVAQLLADSKLIADQLDDLGVERAQGDDATARAQSLIVIWMVPATVFDDAGWPGGETATTDADRREARRQTAGQWLARQGVALVTTAGVPPATTTAAT